MHRPMPACFRGVATPPITTAVGSTLTTSVYETHLGFAALTWSRTVLGLSLRTEIRLPSSSYYCSASTSSVSSSAFSSSTDSNYETLFFQFRPWILWKRCGVKKFHLKDQQRKVDFAWDLSRATFPSAGGPEPTSGFSLSIAVDGEMFLIVGDFKDEVVYRRAKMRKPNHSISSGKRAFSKRKRTPTNPLLISRSEHVIVSDTCCGSHRPYSTRATMGGKERDISIVLGGKREKDAKLMVALDGDKVLQVKHLRWKFRGNERVQTDDGCIQVSWDVHDWLFTSSSTPQTTSPENIGQAMLTFRFDPNEKERHFQNNSCNLAEQRMYGWGRYGNIERCNSSRSTSNMMRKGKKILQKTSSSSSSASMGSSVSNSSVLGWASAEETELKESDGFFLVVYIWKQ
ncbi:hypothetical protein ZOSMA_17G01280 [Zostera marina]|uniref:DUF868 family protein n=1 Tax=Zostera marina TaxID=29655 RepID=A0A0K9PTK6_ZOSMR|nr:hypothetical protein ZOSMA_17G01280 [Zostera marina]